MSQNTSASCDDTARRVATELRPGICVSLHLRWERSRCLGCLTMRTNSDEHSSPADTSAAAGRRPARHSRRSLRRLRHRLMCLPGVSHRASDAGFMGFFTPERVSPRTSGSALAGFAYRAACLSRGGEVDGPFGVTFVSQRTSDAHSMGFSACPLVSPRGSTDR
jgi:hypothetical protein